MKRINSLLFLAHLAICRNDNKSEGKRHSIDFKAGRNSLERNSPVGINMF